MLAVSSPILGENEKTALSKVIDSGWITMGERVREFERDFAKMQGANDAAAVSSCTAGLHLILMALGIGPGDEVLVPSLTFVATVNSVLYVGARPVFVDIESLESPLMSPADASAKCTRKTKAIIVVHYAGYVVGRDTWRELARSRGLILIEDAAQAAGASEAGTFGDAAAFSFYGNKNMTTAEGGMVMAKSTEVLDRIRAMRSHGMTKGTVERAISGLPAYDVTTLGFNYRMDELRAAVGLSQMENLVHWNQKRKTLTGFYVDALVGHKDLIFVPFAQQVATGGCSAHHIMPIILPQNVDRNAVISRLREQKIQTTIHYPPVHTLSFYKERFGCMSLPITETYALRELTIPLHPQMEQQHVEEVVSKLGAALHTSQI